LQAAGKLSRQALVASLVGGFSVLLVLAVLWSGRQSLASAVVVVNLIPIAAWGATWLQMLWRSRRTGDPVPPLRHTAAEHLRYGWPLVPGFALGYLATFGAPLLLGRLSSMTNVGLYGLSYQFVAAVIAANSVLTAFLLPWLIRRHVEDPSATRDYVGGAVPTFYTLWMIATVWLVAVLPLALMAFTGDQFRSAQPVLLVLLVAVPPSVITSLYTILFDVQGRLGRVVLYMVPTTVTNIVCCLVLIPGYGAFGAAVATTLSTAAGQALYIWDQHRHLQVAPGRVWGLWATGLALGVTQVAIGVGTTNRLIWAVVGTLTLSGMVRRAACIDGLLVRQLLGKRLDPLARCINRMLVAET
jgi:O-antigen/teichoic acid export membrane protein